MTHVTPSGLSGEKFDVYNPPDQGLLKMFPVLDKSEQNFIIINFSNFSNCLRKFNLFLAVSFLSIRTFFKLLKAKFGFFIFEDLNFFETVTF